jgi:sugar fermentation stimulation protein A
MKSTLSPVIYETEPLERAEFLDRPNRFIVRCRIGGAKREAYIANPGRLGEILLPTSDLLIANRPHTRMGREVLGARWRRRWAKDHSRSVFLNTGRINDLAQELLSKELLPELKGFEIERREVPFNGSRIDFLLSRRGRPYYLEVKSVTLVEQGLAFFPDATSERGRRHLQELAQRPRGSGAGVLFLVQGDATRFLPDFNNDPAFAESFQRYRSRIQYLPYRVNPVMTRAGSLQFRGRPALLEVPDSLLQAGLVDGGLYMLALRLARSMSLTIGALGRIRFSRGWYVYAGSAKVRLTQRISRHQRLRKKLHYHIDHLRARCSPVHAYPIRAAAAAECEMAGEIGAISDGAVPNFGSSDCGCPSHLFHFSEHPYGLPAFQELLTRLRHRPAAE